MNKDQLPVGEAHVPWSETLIVDKLDGIAN